MLLKIPNTKFNVNFNGGFLVVLCGQTDRRTDGEMNRYDKTGRRPLPWGGIKNWGFWACQLWYSPLSGSPVCDNAPSDSVRGNESFYRFSDY